MSVADGEKLSAGALATAKNTLPATHTEIAGSAMLNSVRWRRRLRCVSEVYKPSRATVKVAGAGPNSRIEAKMKTSETVYRRLPPGHLDP